VIFPSFEGFQRYGGITVIIVTYCIKIVVAFVDGMICGPVILDTFVSYVFACLEIFDTVRSTAQWWVESGF